jgi:hypothetical protein
MTDKELFEKVEKEFYPEKSLRLERFNKTNFQKVLNEIKGPQAPSGNVGGFLSRVASAIPGTRGYRMRSAEARKQEALAKQEELKAKQMKQDLKGGGKHKIGNEIARKYYEANPLYATAYDLVQAGKPLTTDQRAAYNKGNKEIKAQQQGQERKAGAKEQKDKQFLQDSKTFLDATKKKAPNIGAFLEDEKNNLKDVYVKFLLQNTNYGIPKPEEVVQIAKALEQVAIENRNEINPFKNYIIANTPTSSKEVYTHLIDNLPEGLKRQQSKSKGRQPKLSLKNVNDKLAADAAKRGRSLKAHKLEMVRQSTKFEDYVNSEKPVYGTGGAAYKLIKIDKDNGLMTLKDKNNDNIYRFANQLKQPQLELGLPESFEQIIKKYR